MSTGASPVGAGDVPGRRTLWLGAVAPTGRADLVSMANPPFVLPETTEGSLPFAAPLASEGLRRWCASCAPAIAKGVPRWPDRGEGAWEAGRARHGLRAPQTMGARRTGILVRMSPGAVNPKHSGWARNEGGGMGMFMAICSRQEEGQHRVTHRVL